MLYSVSSYLLLPQEPGVYLFLDKGDNVLYVGKAKQLKNRVSSYFANPNLLSGKTRLLVEQIKKIRILIVESELESLLLEANFIKKYRPKYNVRLTDGKAYPMIRITVKELFPAVLMARRPDDPKSMYFGPYPNVKAMRMVLRLLRRIFPFQSVFNHPPRFCLYHHLGLCPCLPALLNTNYKNKHVIANQSELVKQSRKDQQTGLLRRFAPRNDVDEDIRTYRQTIKHIIDFLNGNTKKVIRDLEKERDEASKEENFEKAAAIQKQIDAIILITHPTHKPFEYETNPNLRTDLRQQEMEELQKILASRNVRIDLPQRIECYDVSNTQGTNATGSMVVFTNGEKESSQYRKFKIRLQSGPDDFAMMAEMLTRRLNHPEWSYPQLFIVDGGKGQVSAALKVLKTFQPPTPNLKIHTLTSNFSPALIGLAKREETIITSDFQEIRLPKNSKALQLLMRIRDEAHRFAITYHRKLRSKTSLR